MPNLIPRQHNLMSGMYDYVGNNSPYGATRMLTNVWAQYVWSTGANAYRIVATQNATSATTMSKEGPILGVIVGHKARLLCD
jgi:hypothetical protein